VTVAGRVLSVTWSSGFFFAPCKMMIVISDVAEELAASASRFTEFSRIKMWRYHVTERSHKLYFFY
jgi:hypothetical protein